MEKIKYIGVFDTSSQVYSSLVDQTVASFKASLQVEEDQEEDDRIQYATGIKTKRLAAGHIREVREDEDIAWANKEEEREEKSRHEEVDSVKPS